MKIQCDVCNNKEASVYCSADEAALCEGCDHRVHHVNKLASKHQRFSLLQHSPKQLPLCDICQERRGFLFCQQDRAILCRECDVPIHKANEHTQKHNRYLLTGIKLSVNSDLYSSPSATVSVSSAITTTETATLENVQLMNGGGNSLTSSISEYIEMLPGWHVEDFLDSSTPNVFSKIGDEEDMSFWDADLETHMTSLPQKSMGIWVPQAPPPNQHTQNHFFPTSNLNFTQQIGFKSTRKWIHHDNSFTVPQISPPSTPFKRSRTLF